MTDEITYYKPPFKHRLLRWFHLPIKLLLKIAVLAYSFRGNYPEWVLTPDDKVSPFGSGTTPTASKEATAMKVYAIGSRIHPSFGRWLGDVYWLAWRNGGYALAYMQKPEWLKNPEIQYHKLLFRRKISGKELQYLLRQPDGTWLWETQRRYGPFIIITGYRVQPMFDGAEENASRLLRGEPLAPRPAFHPNMDGRRIFSIRTKRTM